MNRGILLVVGFGVGLSFGLMANSAGAQAMVGPSLADSQSALAAAEAAAVEMGVGLTCAVVDSRGALVALARMDSARYFTADVAVGDGVDITDATVSSTGTGAGASTITIMGTTSGSDGVNLGNAATITSVAGTISLTGDATAGGNDGVHADAAATVSSRGVGPAVPPQKARRTGRGWQP